MEDRKRAVSSNHLLKLALLMRALALEGPSSKYDLSKYNYSKDKKKSIRFSWPLVHKLLRELIKDKRVQKYGKKKIKIHETTLYGLSFLGLLWIFAGTNVSQNTSIDQKEKIKAIKKYSDIHPIFKSWEKLEKSFNSKVIYPVLIYASLATLGLEGSGLVFEPLFPILRISELTREEHGDKIAPFFIEQAKEAFTMNFFCLLSKFRNEVNEASIPEIYEYSKNILEKKLTEFERMKKLISKFK